jgi:hypothetical protein
MRAWLRTREKHARWLQRGVALVLILILILAGTALLMGGQAPSPGYVLEGERFSLKDANGKERAWLGLDHGKPVLRFLGNNGKERASLALEDRGIILRVLDTSGKLQAGLSVEDQGVALVAVNKNGRPSVGESALMNRTRIFVPTRGRTAGP